MDHREWQRRPISRQRLPRAAAAEAEFMKAGAAPGCRKEGSAALASSGIVAGSCRGFGGAVRVAGRTGVCGAALRRPSAILCPAGGTGAGSLVVGGTGGVLGTEAGAGVVDLLRPVILPKNF
ncbi:MAG UNVERIFIED_CONTAM: hypothetical protein LVR18_04850 [Planctomycetaceae bacterium]